MTTETVPTPPAKLAKVKLVGTDGNAYAIMGTCIREGRRAGYTQEQLDQYKKESTSGDYDNLLCTSMKWFDVR